MIVIGGIARMASRDRRGDSYTWRRFYVADVGDVMI